MSCRETASIPDVCLCRSGNAPSAKQLKRAAVLAKAAAGVYIVEPGSKPAENELMRRHNLTEIHAGIFVAEKSHGAALVLLSELYAQGEASSGGDLNLVQLSIPAEQFCLEVEVLPDDQALKVSSESNIRKTYVSSKGLREQPKAHTATCEALG